MASFLKRFTSLSHHRTVGEVVCSTENGCCAISSEVSESTGGEHSSSVRVGEYFPLMTADSLVVAAQDVVRAEHLKLASRESIMLASGSPSFSENQSCTVWLCEATRGVNKLLPSK